MLTLVFVVNFIGEGCFLELTQKVVKVLAQDFLILEMQVVPHCTICLGFEISI